MPLEGQHHTEQSRTGPIFSIPVRSLVRVHSGWRTLAIPKTNLQLRFAGAKSILFCFAAKNTSSGGTEKSAELREECYVQRIQPLLRKSKVPEIPEAMQVTKPYAAFVRSG